jgi:hypothetical protein
VLVFVIFTMFVYFGACCDEPTFSGPTTPHKWRPHGGCVCVGLWLGRLPSESDVGLDEDIFMDVDEAVVLDEALCITNLLPKKSARYISRYECFCKDLKLAQAGRCSKRPCFTFFGTKLTTNRVRQHALGRHSTRGCSATTAASSTAAWATAMSGKRCRTSN